MSSGLEEDVVWLKQQLEGAYEIKTEILGFDDHLLHDGKVLNRIVSCSSDSWHLEADPRHSELVVQILGITEKGLSTPGVDGIPEDDFESDVPLTGTDITTFRGVPAR